MLDRRVGGLSVAGVYLKLFLICGIMGLPVMAGCVSNNESPSPQETTENANDIQQSGSSSQTHSEHLDSVMKGLIESSNRTEYAATHELRLRDDTVLARIELRDNKQLPGSVSVQIDSRYQNIVLGYVDISDLSELADHQNVSRVAAPTQIQTAS